MIIFGTRGVTYSAGSGDFYCPQCRSNLPYSRKRVRRFFTLYFIPVIPLDLHGEYIECKQCRGTYRPEVLEYDPQSESAEFEAEFHQAVKRVMVHMMLADGEIEDEETQTIRHVYGQLTNCEMSEEDVLSEIEQVQHEQQDVTTSLAKWAGHLNDNGKEMVIKAAFLVAAADGEFQDEEKELLAAVGQALGMSSAHLNGVIGSMLKE